VLDGTARARQHQQPGVPARRRFLRHELVGQVEIEVGDVHA
jgi:hypothetical protein